MIYNLLVLIIFLITHYFSCYIWIEFIHYINQLIFNVQISHCLPFYVFWDICHDFIQISKYCMYIKITSVIHLKQNMICTLLSIPILLCTSFNSVMCWYLFFFDHLIRTREERSALFIPIIFYKLIVSLNSTSNVIGIIFYKYF